MNILAKKLILCTIRQANFSISRALSTQNFLIMASSFIHLLVVSNDVTVVVMYTKSFENPDGQGHIQFAAQQTRKLYMQIWYKRLNKRVLNRIT
jgi:hypothetical protein